MQDLKLGKGDASCHWEGVWSPCFMMLTVPVMAPALVEICP